MATLTIVCAWCNKKLSSSKEPSLQSDMTSHGMCGACKSKMDKEMEQRRQVAERRGK